MSMSRVRAVTIAVLFTAMTAAACGKKPPPPPPAPPPPPPPTAPATPPPPPPPPAPAPAPERALTEEEKFAAMSLADLNASKPLGDVLLRLRQRGAVRRGARRDLEEQRVAEALDEHPYFHRRPLRRAGHGGIQPRPGRTAGHGGEGLSVESRSRRRSRGHREQGQGAAVLQRPRRNVLRAEPARPLHSDRKVGRRGREPALNFRRKSRTGSRPPSFPRRGPRLRLAGPAHPAPDVPPPDGSRRRQSLQPRSSFSPDRQGAVLQVRASGGCPA